MYTQYIKCARHFVTNTGVSFCILYLPFPYLRYTFIKN